MVHLRIGCRPSRLAVTQTEQSAAYLCARSPGTTFELVKIETSGDRTKGDLKPFGGKGLFSQEIEAALGRGDVNLVIHCLKDLPGDKPPTEGLEFAGYLPREDAADVLITRGDVGLADLPQGATVGSSSPRRLAQLRAARPDFTLQTVFRGNVDTRLAKVNDKVVDATLLAAAGLNRLGMKAGRRLDPWEFLPALGQGTLVLQHRAGDEAVAAICAASNDPTTDYVSTTERALLVALKGDCFSAIAGLCAPAGDGYRFEAAVFDVHGSDVARASLESDPGEPAEVLGLRMADALNAQGAAELIARGRG
ncbi:MAG: hydroxymethylbilane synthase [Pseudomonadota bacterium]|jgi:hydroxymethylbilane synthase